MSNTTEKYLTYRGDIRAVAPFGKSLAFVTVHPEKRPTPVYLLDLDKLTIKTAELPCGGSAVFADGDKLWVAGSDGRLYAMLSGDAEASSVSTPFEPAPAALAPLAGDRLAVLHGSQVSIVDRAKAKTQQTLELPETGTALTSDPTGQWLVVGTQKGQVLVFDCEEKKEFLLSASEKLHEGAVTALLFEPEELRFYSAGLDHKLLLTHARGKLEPEDRGRGATHGDQITALLHVHDERFVTGSRDKTLKSWPRGGNARPATLSDGVGAVVAACLVNIHDRPHLVIACDDNTLRLFVIDAAGRFGQCSHKVYDLYAWAAHEFEENTSSIREVALKTLAGHGDSRCLDLLAKRVDQDPDHSLRRMAAELLGNSGHPRAIPLLEKTLSHRDDGVRLASLAGLRKLVGATELRPLDLALKVKQPDVGTAAVSGLQELAKKDDQALSRLVEALSVDPYEVRQAALLALEAVHDKKSAEADLTALNAKHADVRRLALIRLYQRKMLDDALVQAALRRRMEDKEASVRQAAFLVSLLARDKLAEALRSRDKDLHRQLVELETFSLEAKTDTKADAKADAKQAEPPKPKKGKLNLDAADLAPLLQATACRSLDICLAGAGGLALLGDSRAFGMLLQLSREEDASARVHVCRALAALADPRSIKRLRTLLHDSAAEVRDAAFTALAELYDKQPLEAAAAGLNASHEDVRRRGIQVLFREVKKSPPKQAGEPGWELVVRALNDSYAGIRQEAFKSVLNLQLVGGGVHTLQFVRQSIHADVRREVLTEAMGQSDQGWAWSLLLEMFDDPDKTLRTEAFEFALKKTKGRDLAPLESALKSVHADVRLLSVNELIKKHTKAAQQLLVTVLTDAEKDVRQTAIESLISDDAEAALRAALSSQFPDVKVRSAKALARHGDSAALAPLLALASQAEPEEKEPLKLWLELVGEALVGLAELGDPAALPTVAPLIDSKHSEIRKAAAHALMGISRLEQSDALRKALQHSDAQVKFRAALGLAYCGDPSAASLVFSDDSRKMLTPAAQLTAAVALGEVAEDQLIGLLDSDDESNRQAALLLLLCQEMLNHNGSPTRCLAALASQMPRVRLAAARALQSFADPAAFQQFVVDQFNDRGEAQDWTIPAETVLAFARLIVFAPPQLRGRTAKLLNTLSEEKQHAWDLAWEMHAKRFAAELKAVEKTAAQHKLPKLQAEPAELQQLAFGAYVGLVREQGSAHAKRSKANLGAQVLRVRQTALARLLEMSQADGTFTPSALPVMVQSLGDPNQAVRLQAFEQLQKLGMDSADLAREALETRHNDLGIEGLKLLTSGSSKTQGQKVLEEVMLTRTDQLAQEAAELLCEQLKDKKRTEVAHKALNAVYQQLRDVALNWLNSEYNEDKKAQQYLREALESRYRHVRLSAALLLANKKDAAAFEALVELLGQAQERRQQVQIIRAMEALGDPRVPDAFMDRVEKDPSGTALVDELFYATGRFRLPANAPRLLALMEYPKWRQGSFNALFVLSGCDQKIEDPQDENPDHTWEEKQHPRHGDILAQMLDRCISLSEPALLGRLIPSARWSRTSEVDIPLATLLAHPDDRLREAVVEAIGFRLRKRKGPADGLIKTLEHKEAITRFLAAEGLALAQRAEGINVLLASVELMPEIAGRQRAVWALGELGDERALDLLLKLANEAGHALQEFAAEAIGHLGSSKKQEDIFKVLSTLAKGNDGLARMAVRGLRWFNTFEGWQLVRERVRDQDCYFRGLAVEMLGYNDDPATRDLLLHLLSDEDDGGEVLDEALTAARRLWGPDSLEPDYAFLKNGCMEDDLDVDQEVIKRVAEKGTADRIFDVLQHCKPSVRQILGANLLNRDPAPVKEAQAVISAAHVEAVIVAAHILGRVAHKPSAKSLVQAFTEWLTRWGESRRRMLRERRDYDMELSSQTECLRLLAWACSRVEAGNKELIAAAAEWPDDAHYRPVRYSILTSLADSKPDAAALQLFESIALGTSTIGSTAELRVLAADAIARHQAKKADKLAEQMLSDRISLQHMASAGVKLAPLLQPAAESLHAQGVALPFLIAEGNLKGLQTVAQNKKLPEAARLGALEAMAQLASEAGEKALKSFAEQKDETEELRKAAWRGVRRSLRSRRKLAEVKK